MELVVWAEWWQRVGERELRSVAMRDWDPIGVADEPLAASEYDNYLGQIVKRLRAGSSDEELAEYLASVATDQMGLETRPKAVTQAARRIREWYDASTARFAGSS